MFILAGLPLTETREIYGTHVKYRRKVATRKVRQNAPKAKANPERQKITETALSAHCCQLLPTFWPLPICLGGPTL